MQASYQHEYYLFSSFLPFPQTCPIASHYCHCDFTSIRQSFILHLTFHFAGGAADGWRSFHWLIVRTKALPCCFQICLHCWYWEGDPRPLLQIISRENFGDNYFALWLMAFTHQHGISRDKIYFCINNLFVNYFARSHSVFIC